jgi:SsrA-binding protein
MKKEKKENKEHKEYKVITTHREARHYYEVLETYEAGVVLVGCEVKSLRDSQASLAASFARFEGPDLLLMNAYIAPYERGNRENPESKRPRKLLMHKNQLNKLKAHVQERGLALIPLKLYFNDNGMVKLELSLAKSKKFHDQRTDIKKKQVARDIDRAIKNRNRK